MNNLKVFENDQLGNIRVIDQNGEPIIEIVPPKEITIFERIFLEFTENYFCITIVKVTGTNEIIKIPLSEV